MKDKGNLEYTNNTLYKYLILYLNKNELKTVINQKLWIETPISINIDVHLFV